LTNPAHIHQPILRHLKTGEYWTLHHGAIIGRRSDCDIKLTNEAGISRHHARCHINQWSVMLEDLGSLNGTLINDALIPGLTELQIGDIVVFDEQRYEFQWHPPLDTAAADRPTELVRPPANLQAHAVAATQNTATYPDGASLNQPPTPEIRVVANGPAHQRPSMLYDEVDAELDQTGVNNTGLDRLGLDQNNLPQGLRPVADIPAPVASPAVDAEPPADEPHTADDPMASYADARRQVVRTAKERRHEIPRYARGKPIGSQADDEEGGQIFRKYGFVFAVIVFLAALLYLITTAL